MRTKFIALALLLAPSAASAQVIINHAALDQLAGIPPSVITAPPEIRQPPRKVTYRPVVHKPVAPPASSAKLASPIAPKPALPAPAPAAPQTQLAVAKPVLPKPAAPVAHPPAATAVTFAAGTSDLPPGIIAQLKPFCAMAGPSGPITIDAYAAADPSDPSAAPRLSLARAFALRDALMACGIPSASIIARANGVSKNANIAEISASP